MSDDAQHFESEAPAEGDKIVDKSAAIADPQKRAADPDIIGGKDMRKEGVKVVTNRGTERR